MPKGWQRLVAGPKFALSVVAIATVTSVIVPARARAAEPGEAFDDPKLARELPAAPPVVAPPVVAPAVVAPAVPAPIVGAAAPAKTPAPPVKPTEGAVATAPAAPPAAVAPVPAKTPAAAVAAPSPAPVVPPPVVAPPVAAEAPAAAPVAAAIAPPSSAPVPPPAAVPVAPAPEAAVTPAAPEAPPSPAPATGTADLTAKARPPEVPAPAPSGPWPYHPRLKLGYRYFSFSRMPASGSTAPTAAETFQSVSLDVYPTSSYLRVGFSSQFGWESGQFQRTGDYFLAESVTTGFQLPGRFTPFVEGLAGAGYMRRLQGGSSSPTAYWQLGVDGGVEIYVAKRAYVSVAIGYLHPGNLFLQQKNLSGINADTWSLKVGLGI